MPRSSVRVMRFALGGLLATLAACGLFAPPGEYGGGASERADGGDDGGSDDATVQPEATVLPDGNVVVPGSIGTLAVMAGERDPSTPSDNPAWSADAWSGVLDASGRVVSWRVEKSASIVGPFDCAAIIDNRWVMINDGFGLFGGRGTALQSTAWGPGIVGDWRAARANMPGGIDELTRTFSSPYLVMVGGTRTVAVDGGTNTFYVNEVYMESVDVAGNDLGAPTPRNPLTTARSRPGLAVGAGYLYVVGGRTPGNNITASIEVSTLDMGAPGPFTELGQAMNGAEPHKVFLPGVVVAEGYLFIAGGRVTTANGVTEVVLSSKIDPATGTLGEFHTLTGMPSALRDFGFVAFKSRLYVLGGINSTGGRTDEVHVATIAADGTIGAWDTTNAKLPAARSDMVAVGY